MDLKNLILAIAEYSGNTTCLDENCFFLNGYKIEINGSLAKSERATFRFYTIRSLLLELSNAGLISSEAIGHIQNRYRHLTKEE
jgi:hypothetical protein